MTIQDSDLIQVQNLTGSKVSYFIPETNNVRHFEGQQLRKDITAGELRMLYATKGGRTLLEDYLGIKNKELAREFNISADIFYYFSLRIFAIKKPSKNLFGITHKVPLILVGNISIPSSIFISIGTIFTLYSFKTLFTISSFSF